MGSRFICRLLGTSAIVVLVAGCLPLAALAGTTGSIAGVVTDAASRAPIAAATVVASSPSQVATTTTDGAGRFSFISLAPETYTIEVKHSGYEPVAIGGIAVFADQNQSIPIALQKSLKEIAKVTSRSSLSTVRAGTGTDVYSVNPELAQAASALGGGGSLNSTYSAIAAMPGAYVPPNQVGVNQTVYIRGGYYDQIGFEFDGVPINRSFDNYPSGSESTLGQQELQIYTGGGESDSNASGLGGFINQVIKTGTHPGYANAGGALGPPTFYHDARIEAGGSTPDRTFSYYAGISGTDQDFRYFDQFNGAPISQTIPYGYWPAHITSATLAFWPAIYPSCNNDGTYDNPAVDNGIVTNDVGCFGYYPSSYGQPATIMDRQVVTNFHFAIPHKHDAGRDDIQLLYTNSANLTQYYTSADDAGALGLGLINNGLLQTPSDVYAGNTNQWPDFYTFPTGTQWLAPASTPAVAYLYPGSPQTRCANVTGVTNACPLDANGNQETVQVPNNYRDGEWQNASIVKLQYQKNFGSTAYVRLFGYSFYSNSDEDSANGYGNNVSLGVLSYQYEIGSHTRGAELQFADQLSGSNLLSGMASYLTSNTLRYYNHNYLNGSGAQTSNFTNGKQCFATASGPGIDPNSNYSPGAPAPCNDPISQGTFGTPYGSFTGQSPCSDGELMPSAPACASGASMQLTYLGLTADENTVQPVISSASLEDEWHPNDRWQINPSLRFERDQFDLANTQNPGTNFWFAAAQREFCVNPVTRNPLFVPQPPQSISFYTPYVTLNCPTDSSTGTPVQTVHPDGTDGILLTNDYPSTYAVSYVLPRISATYTVDPDTVLRVSAGRYAQQPQNYEIQYATAQANLASSLLGFIPFGFDSPLHPAQAQFSNNYDFSYEHHFRGTDVSMKVTPYYRWGTNQLYETVNLPSLGVSPSFNAGTLRVDGIEAEIAKGDFDKNGLSFTLSYTYTNATEMWNNFQGSTVGPVDNYNQDIQEFNALTQAGGGSPCYDNNFGTTPNPPVMPAPPSQVLPDPTCAQLGTGASGSNPFNAPIRNPYYSMSPQPGLAPHAWYSPGLELPYLSPNTFALVLNYKHNKWAITPSMSLQEGTTYGSPADVIGIDPRNCTQNQGGVGVTDGNPLNADYTTCGSAITNDGTTPGQLYIPNPQTGTFDTFGQFRQPWEFNLGMQASYDINPRLSARLVVANLLNRCFGGSAEPWTAANPPSSTTCGYTSNTFYVGGNFYNGTGPNDVTANGVKANPYFLQSFVPSYGDPFSSNYPLALNLYLSVQVKL